MGERAMKINTKLNLKGCWAMVNRIQEASTPAEIRKRCQIAITWLDANEIISIDDYNSLIETIAYLHRESYHC